MIIENKNVKCVRSKNYNYNFNKQNGYFERWGKTKEDDPQFAPSPEILDLEISSGKDCLGNCPYCYKSNGSGNETTHNMSLEDFKIIVDKMKPFLTQIAFGIMNIGTNPDFFKMMRHSREKGIIPNYTCHGFDMTEEYANQTAELCGAVAVSYHNKDKCYNTIKMLTDRGMKQINIHYVLSNDSYKEAFKVIEDMKQDSRLSKMNAVVFLRYKPKGRNKGKYNSVSVQDYKLLISKCEELEIKYGMDSCSAELYLEAIQDNPDKERISQYVESCESFGLFSSYINCYGKYFPCSFAEGEGEWREGLDVLNCKSFSEIWNNPLLLKYRELSLSTARDFGKCGLCRKCLVFKEINLE